MAKQPYSNTGLAKYLEAQLLALRHKKTQAEVAEEAGFANPNMMTMIKKGATKLPLDRVPALATALGCDPALLLRLALEQSEGSTATAAIYDIFGQSPVSRNEMGWIKEIRSASGDTDPRLTSRGAGAIRGVFGK